MPVSDFECQIARGQIGRYLGGGALSPQAMQGLEEHIAECPGCKDLVAERKAALVGMLDGPTPTHAVVSLPKAESAPNPLVAAIRARSAVEGTPAPKAAPRYAPAKHNPAMGKPLLLAGLLAVVLVAMSYLTKGSGGKGVLGGKAATAFAGTTLPDSPAPKPVEKEPVTPKPVVPKPVEAPKPVFGPPTPKKIVAFEPKPAVKVVRKTRVAARRRPVRKRRVAARPKKPHAAVRVYRPDGTPL